MPTQNPLRKHLFFLFCEAPLARLLARFRAQSARAGTGGFYFCLPRGIKGTMRGLCKRNPGPPRIVSGSRLLRGKGFICPFLTVLFAAQFLLYAQEPAPVEPVYNEPVNTSAQTQTSWQKLREDLGGYYKMLTTFSKTRDTDEPFYAALQRLRLEYSPQLTERLGLNIVYDHELLIHDFHNSIDFSLIKQRDQKNLSFWDADHVLTDSKHVYERHLLYRAYLRYEFDSSRFTLGKQLVDWGKMRSYSPADLFNQPLPSDIEADERTGFDALYYEYFGEEYGWSAIYGPGRGKNVKNSGGLRFNKKIGTYDTFLMAAKYQKEKVAGFGWDGYIQDAGFRGEFTYTKEGDKTYPRIALGLDNSFTRNFYGLIEYFYNGAARENTEEFLSNIRVARQLLSIRKQLLSFLATYQATPLLKANLMSIVDVTGKSAFFNPELRYNVVKNTDVAAGAQLFSRGSQDSEFNSYRNLYYIELKGYF